MPNGEEPAANAPTDTEARLDELRQSKEEQLQLKDEQLRSKDEQLQSKREEAASLREQLKDAKEEVAQAREDAKEEVAQARKDAEEMVGQAREEAEAATGRANEYKTSLAKDNSNKRLLEAELKGQSGLSDFIRQSLSDILAGVDNAAVEARSRQMEGGLKESGFTTPGRVGFPSGSGRDSMVDFDLAVVAGTRTTDGDKQNEESEIGAKIDFMKVIALPFSVDARRRVQRERSSEESREQTHHNRIRFSVPVTFASLDDPTE